MVESEPKKIFLIIDIIHLHDTRSYLPYQLDSSLKQLLKAVLHFLPISTALIREKVEK